VGRRPAGPVGPYSVEAHAGRLGGPHAFRRGLLLRGWGVRRLELEFSRLEPHEGGVREAYRPKGLLAFTARTKEYIRIL